MFGLGLIRFVPAPLRPPIVRSVDALRTRVIRWRLSQRSASERAERRAHAARHADPDAPLTIIGLFASPTGLGQGARLMLAEQKRQGRAVQAVDCTAALLLPGGPVPEGVALPPFLDSLAPGPIVIHLNPPLYGLMYLRLPQHLRRQARLIAYWAWELDRVPASWAEAVRAADEIWVPSDFVADAVRARLTGRDAVPVRVVPHPVDALPFGPRRTAESIRAARARHDLPDEAFIAACSFSMSSNYARKNPMGAVAAFQAAFPRSGRPALLILRCNDREVWSPGHAELLRAAAADPRILVLDGAPRRIPIGDLYYVADVYLSLHRSEGYGLNLAEAASLGTPVIATGWGLAADIAARPEVQQVASRLVPVRDPQGAYDEPGAEWAEPDSADAAAKLRALAAP